MFKLIRSTAFRSLLSGFLTAIAVCHTNILLVWICFIPLFSNLHQLTPKKAFQSGMLFGAAIAMAGFYWMIPGAERFTNSSIIYGIIVFVLSGCFFSVFFGCLAWIFSLLKIDKNPDKAVFMNATWVASLFCLGEAILTYLSSGFPWFDFHAGYPLAANLYTIQPAAFFGIYILSFIVLFVNYLAADFLRTKKWKKLLIPLVTIGIYFLAGYFILHNFESKFRPGKTVNIAILSENIAPQIKWNDSTGDELAARLLVMSRQAVALKPDIALWSESAIPWTYQKDDDLVNAILKITQPAGITHLLGINTQTDDPNVVYNSAYAITPEGKLTGRYDKQVLLSLIEKPMRGIVIPFRSSDGFTAKTSDYSSPLNTHYGKAGIIICNESAVPEVAHKSVKQGATFLCNMSNDGWFKNTYIVGLHFYSARLRAVETRKDMVVNSNEGYCGLIKASGIIASQARSNQATVKRVTINENHFTTLATNSQWVFSYFCMGIFLMALSSSLIKRIQQR